MCMCRKYSIIRAAPIAEEENRRNSSDIRRLGMGW